MLIYNTTFQVDDDVHDNFMIWIKESYIPEVQKHGALKAPRICRILSHRGKQWITTSLASGTGSAAK